MIWKRERCRLIKPMMFLNSSRFCDNHGFDMHLFAKKKKKSVTLFLKSLNDYKHFILKTTLKKDLQNFQ